jgi:hypothetical protein
MVGNRSSKIGVKNPRTVAKSQAKKRIALTKIAKQKLKAQEIHNTLARVLKLSDPRRHSQFKKLNFFRFRANGFTLPILHKKYHIGITDLYLMKTPVKELIKEFGLKAVVRRTSFSVRDHDSIPTRALRPAGVTAKEALSCKRITFGVAYHHGGYTKRELFNAGVSKENLARLGKKGEPISQPPKNANKF